jgi:lipoate-protein ligase B
VGYPLLHLGTPQPQPGPDSNLLPQADYIGYLRKLEAVIISTLKGFGLNAEQHPGMTGVWLSAAQNPGLAEKNQTAVARPVKVASIGVKVDSHGISRHGFALNVDPDMSYWKGIIACGLEGYGETSLAEILPAKPEMKDVIERLVAAFAETFTYKMIAGPIQDSNKKI